MVFEASDAASYACDIEKQLRMIHGKGDELVNIGFDGFDTTLHGWNGIALSLQADTLSPYSSEFHLCDSCRTTAMMPLKVAAKNEHFIRLQ